MKDEDIVRRVQANFKRCEDWEAIARHHSEEDTKFGNGDSYNKWQWPQEVQSVRTTDQKPMLTINKTQVHCLQIVNDARQNKAGIEIRAVGDAATAQAADILEGIIRHVEYISDAQQAYDAAMWHAVFGGIGYWRVKLDWVSEDSFDQDIFIERIADPRNVYLDPHIQHFDGSDARFGFVFRDMERADAEAEYPRYKDAMDAPTLDDDMAWNTKDRVRVCEYFEKGEKTDTLIAFSDGTTARKSHLPSEVYAQAKAAGAVQRERMVSEPEIMWYMLIGDKIVDRKPWIGRFVPIIRMVGTETIINGQLDRKGHVRALLDPQRMYNYNSSGSIEYVAAQTKTPWLASVRAIEGYGEHWRTANTSNYSVLPYNDIDDQGRPIEPPRREPGPAAASGHLDGMKIAQEEMMLVSGQYQAVMGAPSNETSGKAINARQRQGDNATYHFIDHQASAIRFTGRVILDLIPHVYDTARVVQILGRDGEPKQVQIAPTMPQAHQSAPGADDDDFDPNAIAAALNPKVGRYDVIADIGPSYGTQRQEAFNAFSQIIAQHPNALQLVGDLWAKAADFPGAEVMAERLGNMVPPQAKGGPSPEMQALQQHMQQMAQQGQQQIEQLHAELQAAKKKLEDKSADIQREDYRAETQRLQAVGGIDPAALRPVIRQLVSEVLQTPIVPVMAQHAAAEQAMMPQAPAPQGGPPNGD